jgi:hypothetical protein
MRAACPGHLILHELLSNYTWHRVQFMKHLIINFTQPYYHIIPIRSKYSQHPVLKQPLSMYFSSCKLPKFSPIQNHRQNYSFVYSNFYVFRQ